MTKTARKQFPNRPTTGILVRVTGDGRWVIRRHLRMTADYWDRHFWRKVKTPQELSAKELVAAGRGEAKASDELFG